MPDKRPMASSTLHCDIYIYMKIWRLSLQNIWRCGLALKARFWWWRTRSWSVCIFEMLNTILIECFTPYRPKHYVQHLIKIVLHISKIYTPATSAMASNDGRKIQFLVRDLSRAVYYRVGRNWWSRYWFSASKYNFGKVQTTISFKIKNRRGFYAYN